MCRAHIVTILWLFNLIIVYIYIKINAFIVLTSAITLYKTRSKKPKIPESCNTINDIHSSFEFLSAFKHCLSVLSIQVAPKGKKPSMNPKCPPLWGTISTVCGLDWNLATGRSGEEQGENITRVHIIRDRGEETHCGVHVHGSISCSATGWRTDRFTVGAGTGAGRGSWEKNKNNSVHTVCYKFTNVWMSVCYFKMASLMTAMIHGGR